MENRQIIKLKEKTMKKLFFAILALILVFAVASCMPEKKEDGNSSETNQNAIETLDPNAALNASEYVIVRSDLAKKTVKEAATALREGIKAKTGIDVKIVTDMKGAADKEILVGASKRISADGIMLDQFKITRMGNTIAIVGGTDEQTAKGVEYFVENLVSDKGLLLADGYSYVPESGFTVTTMKVGGKDVFEVAVASDVDNTSFATNLTTLMSEKVGLPVEQVKKIDKANVIVSADTSIAGIKEDEWAVYTKDSKVYLIGADYYQQKAAFDCFAGLIRESKGELALSDGIIKSDKIQSKDDFYKQTQLVIYPEFPSQIRRNYDYKVTVTQGDKSAKIPVYNHVMEYAEYSRSIGGDHYRRFAMFAFSGERTRVDIRVGKDFSYYTVMPSAKNFETKYKDGVISVFLDKPDYFMIRLDEDDNSVLSVVADYPEYPGDIPTKGDPGVHWIEGWHETESGLYELTEPGAQLYVAPGSVLNARSVVSGEYSRVTGRGLLVDPFQNINERDIRDGGTEGSGWKMMTIKGNGTYFNGVTFVDSRCFNMAIGASNCQIYNYKAFSTMMTTDGLSLFSGDNNYVEHLLLYVADNTIVYSIKSGHIKDVLCGTTCATLFPQGVTNNVLFEELHVMRSDDGFVNNRYNPEEKDRAHNSTIINSDAIDCIHLPHFFSGRGMGLAEKSFIFKNISLPKLTATSDPHGHPGFTDKTFNYLLRVYNGSGYLYTENYHITISNVYVDGKLIDSADKVSQKPPELYLTIDNDDTYEPVERIIHEADYVAKNTVFIGARQVQFEHDVVKEGDTFYIPADAILKYLRTTDTVNTKDIGGVAYVSAKDLEKCSAVKSVSANSRSVTITPVVPEGNLLLPDEGEISYYSEAPSYTVDLVVTEEEGEKVYYMYDHGKYYTAAIARSIVNEMKMYGAGTYTLSFMMKAPKATEISSAVYYDTVQARTKVIEETCEADTRWTEVVISFDVTEAMLNCEGFYFKVGMVKESIQNEWFAMKDIVLEK